MTTSRRATHVVAYALAVTMFVLVAAGCGDSGDKDTEALFAYVNELRAERGAEPWASPDDAVFQAYLQETKDHCASAFDRRATYERYYTEENEEFAEDYRARLAVLCPEAAAELEPPASAGSTAGTSPTTGTAVSTP